MVNIQFITDISVYDSETKKPKLLFRKGQHAKARGIVEVENVFEDYDDYPPEERIMELLGITEPRIMIRNHFTGNYADAYPGCREGFKITLKRLVMSRKTISPNLIVDKDGEIIYMPHKGEYVIPSDKWHLENGRWVGEWEFARVA